MSISLKARFDTAMSLRARFDTAISLAAEFDTAMYLKAQVDRFIESTDFYSLDFSLSKNSFYLALF